GHAPVVAFTRPAEDGAAFWEGVGAIFLLEASDPDGDLDHINIESDLQGGLTWAYEFDDYWAFDASLMAGQHTLTATAFDAAGHTGEDTVEVNSASCTKYYDEIPCRFTFDGEAVPMSVAHNANTAWECQARVRDQDGDTAIADLGDGRFGDGVVLEGDGTSLETYLPVGAGSIPWAVQLWFRGDSGCGSWDDDNPLVSLVDPTGGVIASISVGTGGVQVEEAGSTSSTSAEELSAAWQDEAWHLFALSASEEGILTAWLDGGRSPFISQRFDAIPAFANGVLRLGASADGQTTFCGVLDDVSFANVALDEADFAWTAETLSPFCLGDPL
ncbi:MAG: hypothetical protein ABIO70_29685, partial [Pseudomonadota bacterium]